MHINVGTHSVLVLVLDIGPTARRELELFKDWPAVPPVLIRLASRLSDCVRPHILNSDGSDGLLGLELGVMGMGIASEKDRQLNIVGGMGVSVPLGNVGQPSQAALGVHAWAGYRLGAQTGELESGEMIDLSSWSFIFGPSVSIGSVGVNL